MIGTKQQDKRLIPCQIDGRIDVRLMWIMKFQSPLKFRPENNLKYQTYLYTFLYLVAISLWIDNSTVQMWS